MALAYQALFCAVMRQSQRAIIPTLITQFLQGNGIITVGATSPTRDFIHVIDTCSGFIAAAKTDAAIALDRHLILFEFRVSIAELIETVSEITGLDVVQALKATA